MMSLSNGGSWRRRGAGLAIIAVVSLSGWLHVIRNGETRFMLVDEQGTATRLVIDEALIGAAGGLPKLNQKRITITGERATEVPGAIRVLSLQPDGERR